MLEDKVGELKIKEWLKRVFKEMRRVVCIWMIGCLGEKGIDHGTWVIFVVHSCVYRGGFWSNVFLQTKWKHMQVY